MKQKEKQTNMKIKVLHFDHDKKCENQFLRFSQNKSFRVHFTEQKSEVAKEINCSVLEKIRSVLSIAGLDKSYWADALTYGSHLLNRLLSTAIGGKTPLEIWSGGAARDHGSLKVFDYPTYVDFKKDMLCWTLK